jgi:cyanophycinase
MASNGMQRIDRTLIVIGGHEDKTDKKLILRAVAERVGSGKLVIATVASGIQKEQYEEYERIFRGLGVRHVY